jgi:hypothetical protein
VILFYLLIAVSIAGFLCALLVLVYAVGSVARDADEMAKEHARKLLGHPRAERAEQPWRCIECGVWNFPDDGGFVRTGRGPICEHCAQYEPAEVLR